MAEEPKSRPRVPTPANHPAAGEQVEREESTVSFMNLTTVPAYSKNVAPPRFSIPYRGNLGLGTVRCAEEIKTTTKFCNLSSPVPAALRIHRDKLVNTTLYGVPVLAADPAFLTLDWIDQNRLVRANFQAILQAMQIVIPQGTRMEIKVEYYEHKELGHCVKLSWAGDCFVPINELAEGDDEES